MFWKLQIEAPLDSIELMRNGEKLLPLCSTSDFSLGLIIGERIFSERQIKFNDAWIGRGDSDKGLKLLQEETAFFPNKGEVRVSVPNVWATSIGENNYGWQLHSLDFLKDLVRLHSDTDDIQALARIEQIVRDWADQNLLMPAPSLLSWNDHASAIRLGVLGHVFIYFLRRCSEVTGFLRFLIDLALRHQLVLMDDAFYSKGTNHGLDQAFQLYLSTLTFPTFTATAVAKDLAMRRLQYEIDGAFADDGAHVENSPQYHPVILSSVLQVNATLVSLGGQAAIPNLEQFVPKSLRYLAYILRPDGLFPGIGDSEVAPIRNNLSWLSSFDGWEAVRFVASGGIEGKDFPEWHAAFPDSGYMVFRGDPEQFSQSERPHIVFKCGFLSRYHRQDDDTSFVLNALGEDWLIDGGLYIHDHGVPEREYMRSAQAHNLIMPAGAAAVRLPGDGGISRILETCTDARDAWVVGETHMFSGFVIRRRLSYDGGFALHVSDSCEAETNDVQLYRQLWQIPGTHDVEVSETGFVIRSTVTGNSLSVRIQGENILKIEKATVVTGSLNIWSRAYNKLEAATVVRVDMLGKGRLESRASLTLCRA